MAALAEASGEKRGELMSKPTQYALHRHRALEIEVIVDECERLVPDHRGSFNRFGEHGWRDARRVWGGERETRARENQLLSLFRETPIA